jgi:tetratricopeptide (TPR) repeat protein
VLVAEHGASVSSREVDTPRELIGGRFRVLDTLGRGGMGVVYRTLDRERGVEVALKTLRGITPESVLRFKNEFRALRDVRHPNLVELGELFENDGIWFFTMELVRGLRFLEWVKSSDEDSASFSHPAPPTNEPTDLLGDPTVVDAPATVQHKRATTREPRAQRFATPRCDLGRLRTALAGLARGLGALHAAGKVHRDVKPSNILIDDRGRVVLLDFGVVAELHRAFEERLLFGTARYMAPEQARASTVSPAADWYAVGVLLYQALTGQLPFPEQSTDDLLALKQHATPPKPSDIVGGIPEDLDAIVTNLMQPDPQARHDGAALLELLGSEADEPAWPAMQADRIFVGRREELEVLHGALAASRTRSACVVVEGESGIGKSTLVERFLLDARGAIALRGRCHERERVPFNALDGVIDDLARYLSTRRTSSLERLAPEDVPALVAVFPALQIAFKADPAASTAELRGRGFRALRELFSRVARRKPVVLAIDDLQWADADSAALLDELVGETPLCVIATKRPGPSAADRALHDARVLALGGLAREDARELVELVAADAGERAAAIASETGGHPLFLRELARRHADGPLRLDDVICTRAARLDPIAQRVLAVVAIAGSPIAQQIVTTTLGLGTADAEPHIAALARDQLVRLHGPRPQDAIEPYHDRIRAAIAARHDTGEQRALQLSLATALEAAGASADALHARFEAAGETARATQYIVAAAAAARRAYAFGRAAELYRRALDTTHDAAQRRALLVDLADALANDGRSIEAAEQFAAAAALEPRGSNEQLDLLRRSAERFLMGGRVEQGLETARALLDHVELSLPRTRVRAIGGILWNQLRMRGRALAWDAARTARSLHADICWSMGAGLGMVDTVLGAYFSGRAARIALASGTPLQITRCMAGAMIGAALLGRRARAEHLLAAARRAAADDGTPRAKWYADLAQTGFSFILDNDFVAAHTAARALEREWYAAGQGPAWETDVAMHFALASQQLLGRFAELAERTRTLVHDARPAAICFRRSRCACGSRFATCAPTIRPPRAPTSSTRSRRGCRSPTASATSACGVCGRARASRCTPAAIRIPRSTRSGAACSAR